MLKFVVKYPVVVVLLIGWVILSVVYMYEARSYCSTTYSGTVIGKNDRTGYRNSYYCYLQIAFDSIPTQTLLIHPITYSKYAIGDRFSTREDFHILGVRYEPKDPKYKILNSIVCSLLHTFLVFIGGCALMWYFTFGLYTLNQTISRHLTHS